MRWRHFVGMWWWLLTSVVLNRRQIIHSPQLFRCSGVYVLRDASYYYFWKPHGWILITYAPAVLWEAARYVDRSQGWTFVLVHVSRLPSQIVVICVFSLRLYFGLRFSWQSVYRIDSCLFSVNSVAYLHIMRLWHCAPCCTVWLSVSTLCADHSRILLCL